MAFADLTKEDIEQLQRPAKEAAAIANTAAEKANKAAGEAKGAIADLDSFHPQQLGYSVAMGLELKERPTLCGYPITVIGKGAPDFTPDFIGQMYIDSEGGKIYVSVNAENAGGFKVLN